MSREKEGKAILRDAADYIRSTFGDLKGWKSEFALNLAAVVENMDPVPLMPDRVRMPLASPLRASPLGQNPSKAPKRRK